ncbi:TraR/DksA family transcriptional regulator [Streptomyces sp. NPDC018031]|uniref:TraR/DksA family transcriptional regulator n=1 Tax=Streptomyces sp. NPDC018031 TaxID=3365033 RepID=UPI0037AB7DB7
MNQRSGGDRETFLTPEELRALRADLDEQRVFRREQLRQIATAATVRGGDRRRRPGVAQAEVRAALAASARIVLADVEAALQRMDEGRYGICHRCPRPIDRERLAVVPQARFCAHCQHAGRPAGEADR